MARQPTPLNAVSAASLTPRQAVLPLSYGTTPPPDFYAEHLRQLLTAVLGFFPASDDTLPADSPAANGTLAWAERVLRLSNPAQRLLARLLTRRGPIFRSDLLAYAEVPALDRAIGELEAAGLAERCAIGLGTDLLESLRKAELQAWFADCLDDHSSGPKADLVTAVLRAFTDSMIQHRLSQRLQWLQLLGVEHFRCLRLAYFGERRGTLAQFVIESVGIARYPFYQLSAPDWLTTAPSCLQDLERFHQCCDLTLELAAPRGAPAGQQPAAANALRSRWRIAEQLLQTAPADSQAGRRQRALLRLAQYFERHQQWWPALRCYAVSGIAPAGERRLRILWRLGQPAAARVVAADLAQQAADLRDRAFASGLPQHGIRRPPARVALRRVSLLEPPYTESVEQQALALLQQPDDLGWHVENCLPLGLMGLVYWDVLYGPVAGAFSRPFQTAPMDLGSAGFSHRRAPLIAAAESAWLSTPVQASEQIPQHAVCGTALMERMQATRSRQQGCQNPFVRWQFFSEERLQQLQARMPAVLIARLAHFTLRNLASFRTGFPDLLLLPARAGGPACIEVKGPNDALQPMQRQWLKVLPNLGFAAWVLKIEGGAPPGAT